MTQERLADSLGKKEEQCDDLQARIVKMNTEMQAKERQLAK